ncbi:hypothetical protein IMZ48_43395, partial [Candidatus Bathyarchaeota archaeon]|nr:hypothetical protein [Candidatus Bathyarchaeota archaeon]
VWTVHHALVDGWSESDIVTWVEEEYYKDPERRMDIPPYNRFIRYIDRQDEHLATDFWKNSLAGAPGPVFPPLPNPSYVPKVQRSNRVQHHMESHEEAELEHHIPALEYNSATVATMIQAAWFILVGIYSNTSDVVTGVTLNGRTAPIADIDILPGPTISTVPFRMRFTPDQTVHDLLQDTQQQYLGMLPHSQFGLQNIRQLGQDAASACKFRSLLVVQSANRRQSSRRLLLGRSYSFPVMDFAIVMECEILEGKVDFRATFDHQVLSESDVRGLFTNMEAILHKIATSDSSTTVAQLQSIIPPPSTMLASSDENSTPTSPKPKEKRPMTAPSTMLEKRIYEIWKDLLQTDNFGIDDNFFEMGGGSVLAMRLISSARRAGLSLTVHGVFKSPTVRELASIASRSAESAPIHPFALLQATEVSDLRREAALQCCCTAEAVEDIYPCSRMQMHYITGYPEAHKDPSGPWNWQSQTTWAIPQGVDMGRLKSAWEAAIQRHQSLRTRLVRTSHGIFQVVLREPAGIQWGKTAALDHYQQADRSDPMTFGDRLLRLAVVDPGDGYQRYMVITIHHATYDAYARNLLFNELEMIYFGDGLPEGPPADMNRFIKYITGADKVTAAHFWSSYLSDSSTKPLLSGSSWHRTDELNQVEKSVITEVPKLEGSPVTLPTIIEVACGLAISRRLDCPDVIFYSDRAGRNLPVYGIQDLVGATTLFTPLRVHITPAQRLSDLLLATQRSKAAMMP